MQFGVCNWGNSEKFAAIIWAICRINCKWDFLKSGKAPCCDSPADCPKAFCALITRKMLCTILNMLLPTRDSAGQCIFRQTFEDYLLILISVPPQTFAAAAVGFAFLSYHITLVPHLLIRLAVYSVNRNTSCSGSWVGFCGIDLNPFSMLSPFSEWISIIDHGRII